MDLSSANNRRRNAAPVLPAKIYTQDHINEVVSVIASFYPRFFSAKLQFASLFKKLSTNFGRSF